MALKNRNAKLSDKAADIIAQRKRIVAELASLGPALDAVDTTVITPSDIRSAFAGKRLIDTIEQDYGLYDATTAARVMGYTSKSARNRTSEAHNQQRLIGIPRGGRIHYPSFQFDTKGQPRQIIQQLRTKAADHNWDEWDLLVFLTGPNDGMQGERPADHLDDPEKVIAALELALDPPW